MTSAMMEVTWRASLLAVVSWELQQRLEAERALPPQRELRGPPSHCLPAKLQRRGGTIGGPLPSTGLPGSKGSQLILTFQTAFSYLVSGSHSPCWVSGLLPSSRTRLVLPPVTLSVSTLDWRSRVGFGSFCLRHPLAVLFIRVCISDPPLAHV